MVVKPSPLWGWLVIFHGSKGQVVGAEGLSSFPNFAIIYNDIGVVLINLSISPPVDDLGMDIPERGFLVRPYLIFRHS